MKKATRNWMMQAFDESRGEQLSAMKSALTKKVDELRNEVNTLRDINEKLQLELDNLQNIIKQRR